jgi:hypothetical protein
MRVSIRGAGLCLVSAGMLACTAIGSAPALAGSKPAHCTSVRTDRFYHLAAHGQFGAYSITAAGTGCATARTVASKYVRNPFSVDSPAHRTKRVQGWSCTWRATNQVAQQVPVSCTKPGAKIGFNDRLPSG